MDLLQNFGYQDLHALTLGQKAVPHKGGLGLEYRCLRVLYHCLKVCWLCQVTKGLQLVLQVSHYLLYVSVLEEAHFFYVLAVLLSNELLDLLCWLLVLRGRYQEPGVDFQERVSHLEHPTHPLVFAGGALRMTVWLQSGIVGRAEYVPQKPQQTNLQVLFLHIELLGELLLTVFALNVLLDLLLVL